MFTIQRRVMAIAGIFLIAFIFLEWLPWIFQDAVWPDGSASSREWTFWLQTVSGNWSPPEHPPVSKWAYAFSAAAAILLNNATFLAVVSLVWRFAHIRKRDMRLNQAFTARDQMNKQALYRKFDELAGPDQSLEFRKSIDACFEEGKSRWKEHLIVVFGHEEANRLFERLGAAI